MCTEKLKIAMKLITENELKSQTVKIHTLEEFTFTLIKIVFFLNSSITGILLFRNKLQNLLHHAVNFSLNSTWKKAP